MTHKRNFKTTILRALRRIGWVCKKPIQPTHRIRISKTLNPDGSVTNHSRLQKQPIREEDTFETELHLWNEIHKNAYKTNKNK